MLANSENLNDPLTAMTTNPQDFEPDARQHIDQLLSQHIDQLLLQVETLRTKLELATRAMQKALNWCTGKAEYADGKDDCFALAEEVAPALSEALDSIK